MAFIGNTVTTQGFTPAIDYFSGDGTTTAFTLSRPVASVAQVQAVIENVPQSPGNAFTINGNTITFTSAPPSGTNNIYVYYTSPITQVTGLPSNGMVGAALLDVASSTGTGAMQPPTGTQAQRPGIVNVGYLRYNTTRSALETYNGSTWVSVMNALPTLNVISGAVYTGYPATLTITGTNFVQGAAGVVTFTAGAVTANVSVTPTSNTTLSVAVPSSIYNLALNTVVSVYFTNASGTYYANTDGQRSNTITFTVVTTPTGGTITASGGYTYHTFNSTANFVVYAPITADIMVVAGGGGGGSNRGGGGGAGGMTTNSSISVAAATYVCTVGGGGAACAPGNDSSFIGGTLNYTSTAGGYGGSNGGSPTTKGGNGGSGGGAGSAISQLGGTGTTGQGNNGGGTGGSTGGAGGGGKGGVGGAAPSGAGGTGATGLNGSTFAAGGTGGAVADGSGNGANGGANTGTGGGGGGGANTGGTGGSGIVIVRYLTLV